MNELTFKFKEKKINLFFEFDVTNNVIYETIARELQVDAQKINLIDIKNNNERMDMRFINENIIVELLEEGQSNTNLSKRQRSGYVGISNHEVYFMNCFLQSFFMIIPFRNMVYTWDWKKFVSSKGESKKYLKEKSCVRQLQYLFTELERLDGKYVDPSDYFSEKIKNPIQYTLPNDYFSGMLQSILPDFSNTPLTPVFLEMFCLRVETTSHKNFASIEIDCGKFNFNDGMVSFFSNITKFISFPQYLFIFPQRFSKDYVHLIKNTSTFVYPNNFNMKEIINRVPNDVNYELIQVCYHKGNHWMSDNFGVVIKNELNGQWAHFSDKVVYSTSKEECNSFYSDTSGETESAIYLVYRKVDNVNVQLTKIPQKLLDDTTKEARKRQERATERNKRMNYSNMNVYLGMVKEGDKPWRLEISETSKSVSFNRSGDMGSIAKLAAQEWKLNEKEVTYRIRKFNSKYRAPVDCFRDNETFMMANVNVTDTLILEVYPAPLYRFPETKGSCYVMGVSAFNKETNSFTPLEYIGFESSQKFVDLKQNLEKITGVPAATMKVYYETSSEGSEKELNISPEKSLRESPLYDGHKLYVEDFDPNNPYSACLMVLENAKNQTEIYYNSNITAHDFDKVVFDKSVKIDKRVPVYELLQQVALELGVEVDELKIFNIFERERERVRAEIKNLSLSMTEVVKSKQRVNVYLEKTISQALSDVTLTLYYFNPNVFSYLEKSPFAELPEQENSNLKPKLYTELFELVVKANTPITELRKLVFAQLEKLGLDKPKSPFHLRLREMYAFTPSSIFPHNDTVILSDCVDNIFFPGKPIALQFLDEEETVTSRNVVVPVLQRWCPSTCTFGPRTEIVLDKDMAIEDLRNFISKKFSIEKVGLAKSTKLEIFHSDIDDLFWDPNVPLFVANKKTKFATLSSSPLFLSDGQVLFFRDNNEVKMTLGPKEKSKFEMFMKFNKAISLVAQKEKNKK